MFIPQIVESKSEKIKDALSLILIVLEIFLDKKKAEKPLKEKDSKHWIYLPFLRCSLDH